MSGTDPGCRTVKHLSNKTSRKISAAEVKQWFGNSRQAQLLGSQYREIAARLTKFHWPGDPPAPADAPWLPEMITEPDDRWWDFRAATDAAKTLRDSMPKMLVFQEGLQWAPETRDGYGAIKDLERALFAALPYIEWPFGYYERRTGYKRPKEWHTYARLIARLAIDQMIKAGSVKPGIARNSVVVRVVQRALIRIGIPQSKTLSKTAIGMHLTRWDAKYGLLPRPTAFDHKARGRPL